jgi:hypothetical protein
LQEEGSKISGNSTKFSTKFATKAGVAEDSGGAANGGADLDPTPNTMTINITAVNEPPTWILPPPSGVTINEGQTLRFLVIASPNDLGRGLIAA